MKSKKILVTALLVIFSLLGESHEFWLQPMKYRYQPGDELVVDFMVGENFTGEFWDLNRHQVLKVDLHARGLVKSLLKEVRKTEGKNLITRIEKEGTLMLGMESNSAFIELEGSKFNAYLEEDGIDNILAERKKANRLDEKAREFYKRFAKLLIQSGPATDDTYKKRLGFRYEIVPLSNPYDLKAGDQLTCLVLWEGKPAAHTLVKVWSRSGSNHFLQNLYSDQDGKIAFPVSHPGPWMVSAVKMIHAETEGAEYQSLWTSLVFGAQ